MADAQHLRHPAHAVETTPSLSAASRYVVAGVAVILACYVLSLLAGWPQRATAIIVEETQATSAGASAAESTVSAMQLSEKSSPPIYMVLPFVVMLGAIAIIPLLHGA